jgi:protein involved in polysaccharide export with SLBB domain
MIRRSGEQSKPTVKKGLHQYAERQAAMSFEVVAAGTFEKMRARLLPSILIMLITVSSACAEEYTLGTQDKIRVSVHEWRASAGEVHSWPEISGEFAIGASGSVSLPVIGSISAIGMQPEELASKISKELKAKTGLAVLPDAVVEIVQFRPFYVIGSVERPGEYAYRPGLNVLQAVSISGGFYRIADPELLRVGRDTISTQSNIEALVLEMDQLTVRRSRLEAELKSVDKFDVPHNLSRPESDPSMAKLIDQERLILKARTEELRSQTDALVALKLLLHNEVATLEERVKLKERQLTLIRKELENVGSLVSKGLAVAPRQFSLERSEAEVESNRLEMQTALLRARQDISRVDRDILELRSKRRNDALINLRDSDRRLEEAVQKLQTARKLAAEAQEFAMKVGLKTGSSHDMPRPIFSILRSSAHQSVETIVSETEPVRPGDILKVVLESSNHYQMSRSRPLGSWDQGLTQANSR